MIGEIEDAMIARVAAASDAGVLGYRFGTVASYGGEFDHDGDLSEGELRTLVRRFPAAWVVFGGGPFDQRAADLYDQNANFAVVVAARSLRNEAASRRGDGTSPGSYQLAEDVIGLLAGQTVGLEIDPLAPRAIRTLFNSKVRGEQLSVLVVEFATAFRVDAAAPANLDDFKLFHVDWDVPPFQSHETVPVPDGEADATDLVNVQGDDT